MLIQKRSRVTRMASLARSPLPFGSSRFNNLTSFGWIAVRSLKLCFAYIYLVRTRTITIPSLPFPPISSPSLSSLHVSLVCLVVPMPSFPSVSDLCPYTLLLGCDANFRLRERASSDAADLNTSYVFTLNRQYSISLPYCRPSVGYFVLERSPDNVSDAVCFSFCPFHTHSLNSFQVVIPKFPLPAHTSSCKSTR